MTWGPAKDLQFLQDTDTATRVAILAAGNSELLWKTAATLWRTDMRGSQSSLHSALPGEQ